MSDVFISAGLPVDPALVAAKLAWTSCTQTWNGSTGGGLVWAVSRVDDPALWGPAHDLRSGTRVLLGGRTTLEQADWAAAEHLPYEGGLAARSILARWLQGGVSGIEALNGAALVVVIDERAREAHVWTDRMGAFPAFAWKDEGLIICSHPDVAASVLASAGHSCDFDPVTMAEFLRTGTATHPHTYWRGITHLDAGTRHRFQYGAKPRIADRSVYWRPAYFDSTTKP
jgi:hypothetical protein